MVTFEFLLATIESRLTFRKRSTRLRIEEIEEFDPPQKTSEYLVFADDEYNIGTAYFCEDPSTGTIYRVCPQYSTDFELVNSSIEALRESMKAAAQWSSENGTAQILDHPKTVDALQQQLSTIDPTAFASPHSHWPILVNHIREYATDDDDEMEFWFRLA